MNRSSRDNEKVQKDIPIWLQLTNEQFQELFHKIFSSVSTTTISIEELQQLAMTMYEERKRLHEKQLWSTLLKTIEHGFHRWPTLLKQVILSMNVVRHQSIEYLTDEMYSDVVRIYLHKPVIEQILSHETIIENMLEKYIEDHFRLFDYDYDDNDERLANEIRQQQTDNSNQIEMIERLVQRKYELQLWKEEIQQLYNYQKENRWPSSFRYLHVDIPSFIQTMTEHRIRQQLMDQHCEILHDYKHRLLQLLIVMSEDICSNLENLFNSDMALFWKHQHSLPANEQLSVATLNLIDHRFCMMILKDSYFILDYMEKYLVNSTFDVIDGDSFGEIMNPIELEHDYFSPYINVIDDEVKDFQIQGEEEQEDVSQQLSQLSMTHLNNDDDDSIPTYLQMELLKLHCSMNEQDRRHVAQLLCEIGRYQHYYHLWSLYLQAGRGQLISLQQEEPFWFYNETCIRQQLHDYKLKLDHYQQEYASYKLDTNTQNQIEKLVNDYGLIEIHMESEYKIALLYNKYHDHQLQVQYERKTSTQYQIDIGKQFFETNFKLLTMKYELIYHRLQILYDRPPISYDTLDYHLLPMDVIEKILQQTKTKLMALRLQCLQINIFQYETKLKSQTNEIKVDDTLLHIIHQRIELIHEEMKLKLDFHTKKQLQLLRRGPCYVAPCQLQLKLSDQLLHEQQYQPLRQQLLVDLVEKYPKDKKLFNIIEQKTKEEFNRLFSSSNRTISTTILERSFHEQKIIGTIRKCLHENKLILRRTIDDRNQFCLTDEKHYDEQCQHYMNEHEEDYERLCHRTNMDIEIKQRISKMNKIFNYLEHGHSITQDIHQQLFLHYDDIQLKPIHFLFDGTSIKPMVSMKYNLTWKLSIYLDDLLRSTIEDLFKQQSIVNDDFNFIQCCSSSKLKSTTLLVRIKIQNFFTMFSYQSNVNRIIHVLANHCQSHLINGLSVNVIESLIELYLQHTLFIYQDHIYSFNRGMPSDTHLNRLLSTLCLYYWRKKMFNDNQQFQNEFLLQYTDELLFTWNQSKEHLHVFLKNLKEFYGDTIEMNIEFGMKINIKHIHIENRHGQLYTKMNTSSLILPYVTNYPKVQYQQWFRSTLIRLIHVCSNDQDFTREQINMEIIYLISGYSNEFIENELEKFNSYFNVNIYELQTNEFMYKQLRSRLFKFQRCQNSTVIEFFYFYDYGPYHEFKKKFFSIWSTYTNSHTLLSSKQTKINLTVKHLFSLNHLLTR
ncbi:unnamed protein product [Rotaria socialis]|uniref:Helix-turn-helix domain-containing protein n=3 Tax=Rotaria socialis TaxID=392032 RepID=A0A817Q1Q9_9BILA|nr:unnamed protein product [Rotaria socialis]